MSGPDPSTLIAIVGMAVITVITRSFFSLSSRPWTLPGWARRGLVYAPVAALAAVIVPEVSMTGGHLIAGWRDARLFAAAVAVLWYYRQRSVLGTIVAGMALYLPLHIGLGW